MLKLIGVGLAITAGSFAAAWTGRYRITVPDDFAAQRLADSSFSLFSDDIEVGHTDIAVRPDQLPELWALGLKAEYLGDLELYEGYANFGNEDSLDYRNQYLNYTNQLALLEEWRTRHKSRFSRLQIGSSWENRPIYAYRIQQNVERKTPVRTIVILGGTHAREFIAPSVCLYVVNNLLYQIAFTNSLPRSLKTGDTQIVYIPILNPDGYDYCFTNNRLWRKNRRNNGGGNYGVDLNRNYSVGFGGANSSNLTTSDVYRGPSAFSEPETNALRNYCATLPNVVCFVDYHSYGQQIGWPWTYTTTAPTAYNQLNTWGSTIRSAILNSGGLTYLQGQSAVVIYPAGGTSKDYFYSQFGAMSATIELRDEGVNGFLLPESQIIPTQNESWAGFKAMLPLVAP